MPKGLLSLLWLGRGDIGGLSGTEAKDSMELLLEDEEDIGKRGSDEELLKNSPSTLSTF
jgi:hypothetical protein